MSKDKRKNIKLELAEKERVNILKEVENIDAFLDGKIDMEKAVTLFERLSQKFSFGESVSWLQPYIEDSLSKVQDRLKSVVQILDKEFSSSYTVSSSSDEERNRYFRQVKAYTVVKLHIDSSILLYALGRNGAAIIELHAVVERQSIEALAKQLLKPDKSEIGLKLIERLTLPDISVILRECKLVDEGNVKFAQKLNKLRNGLAHRNAKAVSNAVYSGRELSNAAIDFVAGEVDYATLAVEAVSFLIKIMEWDDLDE